MSNTHNGLGWMHQMHKRGKKICQFMLKVCLYKCKESSDLNFRGKLKAIYSAYLIINIVWYFQKKCDIDILTIFWKWHDNCITIYRQTIFWGLVVNCPEPKTYQTEVLVEESKMWLWQKFANFISCLFLCLHYSKRIYVLKYTVPRSDSSLGSILSQHIIIPEVKVLFVEFRSFFLTFPHFYWRILSRQTFTRFL